MAIMSSNHVCDGDIAVVGSFGTFDGIIRVYRLPGLILQVPVSKKLSLWHRAISTHSKVGTLVHMHPLKA